MKIKIKRQNQKKPKEYEVKYVLIDIPVYLGEDSPDAPLDFPLIFDDHWIAFVEIETGMIGGWKQGYAGNLFSKVVDQGSYYLMDADKNIVAVINGYVPNKLIPPTDGCSDYVNLEIDKNGKIVNWYEKLSLEEFEEDEEED